MPEAPLQKRPYGNLDASDAGELGRLLREAARLLEATDLPGANEALKKVEKAFFLREEKFPARVS